jgi:hypothetical protein
MGAPASLPSGYDALKPGEFVQRRKHTPVVTRPFRPLSPRTIKRRVTGLGFNLGGAVAVMPATDPNSTLQYAMWVADDATFGPGNTVGAHINENGGLQITFQGVADTTYVLDCSVDDNVTYTIIATFNGLDGLKATQTSSSGHLLVVFPKAPANVSSNPPTAVIFGPGFDFSGCQVNTVQ